MTVVIQQGLTSGSSVTAASQAEQETSTEAAKYVAPATQQFHPSAAKCWLKCNGAATTINASYNITSLTDTGTGDLTINIGTDFSSVNWAAVATALATFPAGATDGRYVQSTAQAAGTVTLAFYDHANSPARRDPTSYFFAGFGDQ